jgi:hypothetical protein
MPAPEEKPYDTAMRAGPITFADFERAMLEAAKPHGEQPNSMAEVRLNPVGRDHRS